jgi:MFS family permease
MSPRNRLVTAAFISQVGNWLTLTGLLQYVQSHFGSASTAGMLLAQSLPALFAARGLAQRIAPHHAHRMWLAIQVCLALCSASLVALSASLWFIYAYYAVTTVLRAVANTLFMTFVGDWVAADRRAATFIAIGTAGSITLTVSPAAGGLMASTIGYSWLFLVDAASFLLAAAVLARGVGTRTGARPTIVRESLWRTWVGRPERFSVNLTRPAFAWTWFAVIGAAVNAVEMPVFDDIHQFQADQFGYALACYGVGGLLAFAISQALPRLRLPTVALTICYAAGLAAWVLGGAFGAYIGFAVAGLTYGLVNGQLRAHLDVAAKADGVDPIPLWAWANQVTFLANIVVLGAAAGAFALAVPVVDVAVVALAIAALTPFTMTRLTLVPTRSTAS